jgi:hypothetical protein
MNDAVENTSRSELTTEQIAGVNRRDFDGVPEADSDTASPSESTDTGRMDSPQAAPIPGLPTVTRGEDNQRVQLLGPDELQTVLTRWREIQGEFVDEPRQAIHDADTLVADLMQRLARTFADERNQLEAQLVNGSDVSTEDMRQGLQRYRSFFERLLAA